MANGIIIRPLGQLVQALSRYGQTLYQPPKDTISGVSPEAWYSPLQPIRPIGPPGVEPRGFQYWAGQNLLWTPRADAEYSAARLKQLASYPLARIAIENVKDALCKANWEIQPRPKPGEPRKAAVKRGFDDQNLLKLSRFFEAPDREHAWPEWLRPLLEDMLVIDAWTILIRKTFKGEIVELPTLRGESIVRYIDDNGFTPMPPDPAYAQNWWGIPLVDLTTDQCIYKPRNIVPRNTIASQLYGMCYDSETEILTRDRGFVRFAELRQSDSVATRHPETAELEWQKPSAYINRPYEGEMYAFTSQSMDVLVTPEHRMLVSIPTKGQNGRNEKIMGAADLAEGINQGRKIPVTSEWNGGTGVSEVVFAKTDYRGQEIRISGDDFCALLGAYLAEGNLRTAGGIEIAQGSESKGFSPYSALMRRINLTGEDGYNGKAFTCSYRALSEYFRQFGVSHEKFVPDIIRNAPRRQLQIFWDYFMLGDGSSVVRENKSGRGDPGREREEATTTSLRLSDHLVEIAQKLGFSASVHVRPARYAKVAGNEKLSFCRESYHVRCRYSSEMAVGAAKIPYTGMVHCVTVPNGIVYIRRNGKPCWSGNSPTEQLAPEIEIGMKRLEFTLAYYTEGSIPGVVQVIPRGTPNEKISEAMQWMNSELAGNLSARRQWRMVQGFQEPGKTDQIIFAKEPLLADPFDELHIRKISFGYGISPQRMMRMMNRASAQASQEASEIEGLLPYFASLKSLIDFIIQRKFNYPDYEIVFDPFTEPDPEKEANRLKTLVASAMMTPNEGRAKLGEEARKEPEADQLGVITGSGFVPLGSQGAGLQPGEVKPSDVPDGKPDGAGKKPDEEPEAEGGEAEPARGKQPASPRKPASANKSDGHGLALEASATPSPRDIGFVSGAVIAPPVAPIELEKYSPDQERVPAGEPGGGEFAGGGGGAGAVEAAKKAWDHDPTATAISRQSESLVKTGKASGENGRHAAVLLDELGRAKAEATELYRGLSRHDLKSLGDLKKGSEFGITGLKSFTSDPDVAESYAAGKVVTVLSLGGRSRTVELPDATVAGGEWLTNGRFKVTGIREDEHWSDMLDRDVTTRTIEVRQLGIYGRKR